MPLLILLSLVALATAALLCWPGYSLKRALVRPFPAAYSRILRKNLPVYARLPADLQAQLKRLIKQFLHQKEFIGCNGFQITDEVRVTIAAKAGLLLLNRPTGVYPALKKVLVYPTVFIAPRTEMRPGGVLSHGHQSLSGESWNDDRVILAWDHALPTRENFVPGHDVVLHEFAHQLDSESGVTNGAPLLAGKAQYRRWSAVLSQEFEALQDAVDAGQETLIDPYGASDPAEFFAVATETFFENSSAMAYYHPALYAQLQAYYRVDPRDWN
ncbi:MAG: zinc-dependent peptidase [Burkholderiales bacterium]|nr:zinc-dependent peptidase [Burkholderiales bacterium]